MEALRIQAVVLSGGMSRRFGRDKLREPVPGGLPGEVLIDRPIRALRCVFGPHVAVVGDCHAEIERRADFSIPDAYPRSGPIGGILSALEETGLDVFVLAGDLPLIDESVIRAILAVAEQNPEAWAVLADSGRTEPCIGLYRRPVIPVMRARLSAAAGAALVDLVPESRVQRVPIDPEKALNINTLEDLACARRWISEPAEPAAHCSVPPAPGHS